jgi:hypothetical protein
VIALGIFVVILFLPIAMIGKAVATHAFFWLGLFLPFFLDHIVKRRKFLVLFGAGLVLATVAFYENPLFLLVLPGLYSVIAAPLLQSAMMERQVG